MRSVARENAEEIFKHAELKKSELYQNKNEIRVQFEFNDNTILLIKYDCSKLTKTYYVKKN